MSGTNQEKAAEKMLFEALDGLVSGNVQPWVDMFSDDGVMEFPYAPPGFLSRLDGKTAIAEYMNTYPDHITLKRIEKRGVYCSGDIMVAEFRGDGIAVETGNRFEMNYIGVVKIKNGKADHYRDYWDPLVALKAMGGFDQLLSLGKNGQAS